MSTNPSIPSTHESIRDYFCLRQGRANFDLDPLTDGRFLFGDATWAEDIQKRLQRASVMGRPFRLVWWGQYGIGKTHKLRYTEKLIDSQGYQYYPRYLVASDLEDKSGFDRLQSQMTGALGYETMHRFTEAYTLKIRTGAPIRSIEELADTNHDVAQAVKALGSDNANLANAGWQYLSGTKLSANEMALAAVSKPAIDTANEYAAVHHVFAAIIEHETGGKKLLYLIDEVENLGKIKNKNSATRWQEAIRCLLDVKEVGLVFAIGAENFQGVPSIIIMPDIVRRIQMQNYDQMPAFKPATAERFIRDLLAAVINPDCRAGLETAHGWVDGTNDYESAVYPFTRSAFRLFCDHATVDPKTAKPSEILEALNNAAYEALTAKQSLITEEILHSMEIG